MWYRQVQAYSISYYQYSMTHNIVPILMLILCTVSICFLLHLVDLYWPAVNIVSAPTKLKWRPVENCCFAKGSCKISWGVGERIVGGDGAVKRSKGRPFTAYTQIKGWSKMMGGGMGRYLQYRIKQINVPCSSVHFWLHVTCNHEL